MLPVRNKLTLAYALSGVLAVLLLVASVVGLAQGGSGLYGAYPAELAGLVGQDMVALAVILPLLLMSMWMTARGSARGLLLWTGALFWSAYFYYFYVVGGFNALFLVYIAIISLSLFGLLSLLFAIDTEALRGRFGPGVPVRTIGGFFVFVSLLFAFMWGGLVVSSVLGGTRPDEVLREVAIIDLAVMLPLLFFGGIRLWQRSAWGYVLGGLLLAKTALTGFTMAFTTVLGAWWSGTVQPFQAFLFTLFALMMLGALALLVPYLRAIREERKPAFAGQEFQGGSR